MTTPRTTVKRTWKLPDIGTNVPAWLQEFCVAVKHVLSPPPYPQDDRILVRNGGRATMEWVSLGTALSLSSNGCECTVIFPPTPPSTDPGKTYATVLVGAFNALDTDSTHYDYFCDGVADDVEINAAIVAMATSKGKIVLSEGTFAISASVVPASASITIEGQGPGTILRLDDSAGVTVVSISAVAGVTIADLTIDGNLANNTGTIYGISINAGASYTTIRNCTIQNCVKSSIKDSGASTTRIENNILDTVKAASGGYNIDGPGPKGRVTGNTLILGDDANMLVTNIDTILSDNTFVSSRGESIILFNAAERVLIASNIFLGWASSAIDTDGHACTITGNSFKLSAATTAATIKLSTSGTGAMVSNNLFQVNSSVNQASLSLIRKTGNGTCQIVGNTFNWDSVNVPITTAVEIAAAGASITANSFHGPGTGNVATLSTAINADGLADINISDNFFKEWDLFIDISNGMELCAVTGNVGYDCEVAIEASDTIWATITGNSIEQATDCLIRAASTTGYTQHLSITGNTFGLVTKCIDMGSCQYCTVSGNTMTPDTDATDIPILLRTSAAGKPSRYNTITGNTIVALGGTVPYVIREETSSNGPNIITGNIAIGAATSTISVQHPVTIFRDNFPDVARTYTPTLINSANVSASTAYTCQFIQANSSVTVSGRIDIDAIGASSASVTMSLPVPSVFAQSYQCAGTAVCPTVAGQVAAITAHSQSSQMEWIAVDLTPQPMYFNYTYQILP